jgi:hypothetical protein
MAISLTPHHDHYLFLIRIQFQFENNVVNPIYADIKRTKKQYVRHSFVYILCITRKDQYDCACWILSQLTIQKRT